MDKTCERTIEEGNKEFGLRISKAISDKTVKSFAFGMIKAHGDCDDDNFMLINFTDGTQLRIRYDYVYQIEIHTIK